MAASALSCRLPFCSLLLCDNQRKYLLDDRKLNVLFHTRRWVIYDADREQAFPAGGPAVTVALSFEDVHKSGYGKLQQGINCYNQLGGRPST